MGQYYKIVIERTKDGKVEAYDRTIDGEYTMAKLMEHSYYLNGMVNAISEKLYNEPSRIAWVGDYSEELNPKLYDIAWNGEKYEKLKSTDFTLNGRYIVNHTKKLILDCWKYLVDTIAETKSEWLIHPLPLLTAIGNGMGGGDYRGKNSDAVGTWAWDELEIVEYGKAAEYRKNGYQDYAIVFSEQ